MVHKCTVTFIKDGIAFIELNDTGENVLLRQQDFSNDWKSLREGDTVYATSFERGEGQNDHSVRATKVSVNAGGSRASRAASAAAVERAVRRTITALAALCVSQRWTDVVRPALSALDGVEEIVCYALGCVDDSNVPWQLALLLLIANTLEVPEQRRLVFDPRHGPLDRAVLAHCGVTAVHANERAERQVSVQTLFFMPFAPYTLTDNVLRANWGQLHRVAVIGNPLRWVCDPDWDREAGGHWQRAGRAPCVEAVLGMGGTKEEVLWHGNMRTWLTNGGAEKEDRTLHCLDATLAVFPHTGADARLPPRQKPHWPPQSKL